MKKILSTVIIVALMLSTLLIGASAAERTVLTNLNTYDVYVPENAIDGDPNTFFWSAGGPTTSNYFMVDLGVLSDVTSVHLIMGAEGHNDDYIHNGVIEYSEDGENFTKLCDTTEKDTQNNDKFTARYVRVRPTVDESYWAIIAEFAIEATDKVGEQPGDTNPVNYEEDVYTNGNGDGGAQQINQGPIGVIVTVPENGIRAKWDVMVIVRGEYEIK